MTAYGTIDHERAESAITARKARRLALSYRRDEEMEARLELRRNDPAAFESFPRDQRLAVAYYNLARAAAREGALAEVEAEDAA